MAVRLRLKRLGRKHRPFFRICAMDARTPRDGRVIEELGHYDPMVRDAHARTVLKAERIDYWLSVGALPTEKVGVLIKKYGTDGKYAEKNKEALERLSAARQAIGPVTLPPEPKQKPKKKEAPPAEAAPESETPSDGDAPAAEAEGNETPSSESETAATSESGQ